jgi:hypothetical protein
MDITRLSRKMNGYEIIGTLARTLPNDYPSDAEAVILGHDTTRRSSAFVTACVDLSEQSMFANAPHRLREWYWGHYFEDYDAAVRSLIIRSNATLCLCTHKREKDQHCSTLGCLNYFDPTLVTH